MGFYHPSQILQDAARHGIEILPIDINFSDWDCTLEKKGNAVAARVGLRLVRGLNETQAKLLVDGVRKLKKAISIQELWSASRTQQNTVHQNTVHQNTLRCIARADGFNSMNLNRQKAEWEIQRLKQFTLPLLEIIQTNRKDVNLPSATLEEETLDDYHTASFSTKAHPIEFLRTSISEKGAVTTHYLKENAKNGESLQVAGIVLMRQKPPTAGGFIFITLEDETGSANVIVRPNVYRECRDAIYDSVYLLVSGKVQKANGVTNLMIDDAINLRPVSDDQVDVARNFY